MKKCLLLLIFLISLQLSYAQIAKVVAVVDERTELLSAVFRMANAEEYVNNTLTEYTQELDLFLQNFKQDTLIQYARQIRKSNGIAYDAIMSYAIHLEITDSIRFIKEYFPGQIDKRWNPEMETHFLMLLNDFYQKSNFHRFYESKSTYYKEVENRFQHILKDVDYEWFPYFFGVQTDGSFSVIISLLNRGNYGPNITFTDGTKKVYSINGVYRADSLGFPIFGKGLEPIIIHEFTHSFTNPLVNKNIKQLLPKAKRFYKPVQSLMQQQAYGTPQTMLYEMMVRACVIRYYQDKDSSKVKSLLQEELANGFLWIEELYELLTIYDQNRNKYSTLESFMPEVSALQNSLHPTKMKKEYLKMCGAFVGTSIPNGSKEVAFDTVKVTITFAQQMNTGSYGISYGRKGKQYYPTIVRQFHWDQETQTQFTVTMVLEAGKRYSLSFPGEFFFTREGFPVKGVLHLDFKTQKPK